MHLPRRLWRGQGALLHVSSDVLRSRTPQRFGCVRCQPAAMRACARCSWCLLGCVSHDASLVLLFSSEWACSEESASSCITWVRLVIICSLMNLSSM